MIWTKDKLSGRLREPLTRIAYCSPFSEQEQLAKILLPLVSDVQYKILTYIHQYQCGNTLGNVFSQNRQAFAIFNGDDNNPSFPTILHESIHAAIAIRFGSLTYFPKDDSLDSVGRLIQIIIQIFMVTLKEDIQIEQHPNLLYALSNVDEFTCYSLTDIRFRNLLSNIPYRPHLESKLWIERKNPLTILQMMDQTANLLFRAMERIPPEPQDPGFPEMVLKDLKKRQIDIDLRISLNRSNLVNNHYLTPTYLEL